MKNNKSPYLDSQMARYYAAASGPLQFDAPARDLVDCLNVLPGSRILDIGSGSGLIAAAAFEAGRGTGSVFALDGSIEMLRQQREKGVIRIAADAQDLPFAAGVFDRVAAGFVITHLRDYRRALSNWIRILRQDGILAISAWDAGSTKVSEVWKAAIQQAVPSAVIEEEFTSVIPGDEFFTNRANLVQIFKESGLKNIKEKTNTYFISMNVEQYIDTKIGSVEGTIVRRYLGAEAWASFVQGLAATLRHQFPVRIEYTRKVHFVCGQK